MKSPLASEDERLTIKYGAILPHLHERQRRLFLAAEARALGHGGISRVARLAQVSRGTITVGIKELAGSAATSDRVRQVGGGRPKVVATDPQVLAALDALVEPTTRGDPECPLRWTLKSTRQLAAALQAQGYQISHMTVGTLLHDWGYSLQATQKTLEGTDTPDRDAQFQYIAQEVTAFAHRGQPIISVDTKKKELIGDYANGGQEWQPKGQPEVANVHDFPGPDVPKAIPYGVYDLQQNTGWVTVGSDHDTAQFAVATLERWWEGDGCSQYPQATEILICADGGGSNGSRRRQWKTELQRWATKTGLTITVAHFPPGTSKWNKIEHRLFAQISINWRGKPLTSYEVMLGLIGGTTTRTGLRVHADRDTGRYSTGVTISDAAFNAVQLTPHAFHGEWNYSVSPLPASLQ
jgi:transposase